MRIITIITSLLGSSLLIVPTLAQNSTNPTTDILPQCAAVCLTTAITASPCAFTDQECICNNTAIAQSIPICLAQKCTIKESLLARKFTDTKCNNPIRNKQKTYRLIIDILGSIAGPIVVVRLLSKWYISGSFTLDDYAIAMTAIAGVPNTVLTSYGLLSNGLGRDIWTVTPKQITRFLKVFYFIEVLYFVQLALLKLSLLFFYLRIFPGPGIRRLIWGSIVFDVLFGVVFVVVAAAQCRPVSYYWTSWDGEHQGKCFNINAMAFSNAAISIVFDVWMLALPMSQVIHLKMHWKKKAGVASMLIVGTFVTIVSILRLQALVQFANSQNPTFDNTATGEWSTVEMNIGIICACIPSMRVLVQHVISIFRGGTENQSADKNYLGNGSNAGGNSSKRGAGSSQVRVDGKGIIIRSSFTVTYADQSDEMEEDEMQLVPLKDLEATGGKVVSGGR